MRIDEIHGLVVRARQMEHEIAVTAEMLAAATGDPRDALDSVARGARVRQLLWDSRLPDTGYISTGRTETLAGPPAAAAPPADRVGLTEHLALLRDLYGSALARVSQHLDPMTHELLSRGVAETRSALAELSG